MAKRSNKRLGNSFLGLIIALFLLGSSMMTAFAQQAYPPPQPTPTPLHGQGSSSYSQSIFLPAISDGRQYSYMSYYLSSLDNMYDLGMKRGEQNASRSTPINDLAVLFFGMPQQYGMPDGGTDYGVSILHWPPEAKDYVTNSTVKIAVEDFVLGYYKGQLQTQLQP